MISRWWYSRWYSRAVMNKEVAVSVIGGCSTGGCILRLYTPCWLKVCYLALQHLGEGPQSWGFRLIPVILVLRQKSADDLILRPLGATLTDTSSVLTFTNWANWAHCITNWGSIEVFVAVNCGQLPPATEDTLVILVISYWYFASFNLYQLSLFHLQSRSLWQSTVNICHMPLRTP